MTVTPSLEMSEFVVMLGQEMDIPNEHFLRSMISMWSQKKGGVGDPAMIIVKEF